MEEQTFSRKIWEHLLSSGGYSIGQFSVTVNDDQVRVYHYRTRNVARFPKEDSYEEMEKLCRERGYDLPYLLKNYYPKSFRSLKEYRNKSGHA
ncbi:MAG: hypothetical protein K9N46_00505 [Candidatus Marinimicrobia bacterium]|nr:hypothetical protein [Candidatus Neomarinimicrobiota bacterium]MCF7828044.1 hypothetical protein [Candidatus Neomarinimicrobiota bacterium]MCF7879201.1 hypothetical protein [Candidatus Neomarinimicrobiota bacterium]